MEQIYTQIRRYIDENRQPMLNLWRDLVNTESGTTQIDGVNAVCSILRREMENAGIHTRVRAIQNSGDMLIGEWNPGSSKAPLLLIGHMDTVFKEGAAKENPFRVDENGMAHGPGVLDMKAGLVMALYTVKALDSVDWKERPIKFIFASDEENLHMRSDAKEIFTEEAAGALAAFNFETGYMDNRFVVGRKGGGPVSIKIHGRASHSGIAPEKGRSAVLEAAHKIVEMGMAHVPEGRRVFADMSVYENLLMGAYTRKDKNEIAQSLEMVYKRFPRLKERITQQAGTLSGGEQQMLAVGRALMSNPKMILLDEPSLGLAPNFVEMIFGMIEKINKQGVTVLLIEQNANMALQVSQRAYVLENGLVSMSGKASDIANDPMVKKAYLGMA